MKMGHKPSICGHCGTVVHDAEMSRAIRSPEWESVEGSPIPLGVHWHNAEQAYNFAISAGSASQVELLLFEENDLGYPSFRIRLDPLRNKSGKIWHCRVPVSKATGAMYYGYLMDGPIPGTGTIGHAFDPTKLLLDPYAKSVFFPPEFSRDAARHGGFNIGRAPVGRLDVCRCPFEWGSEPGIRHGSDLVVYEVHVRGFTQHSSSTVESDARGTFAGIIEKIPYLEELGVTAIELMPIFQFDPDDGNYWGYMPLNFFAPHHSYSTNQSACEQHSQFREMVKALHDAGIEVILDVVYNHTCEGDHRGPTYSYRGIANDDYYMLSGNLADPYANYSGTGNTLNTTNATVRQLVVDSLRYWAREMHVDGFRFDLASVFSRGSQGEVDLKAPPIFDQIANDPDLAGVRLIAEPWDAAGLYQLGAQFPDRTWMQWNARYRDTLQKYLAGESGVTPELMSRIYGSSDLFPDDLQHSLRPFQSVNYIASHDGFTLYDLLAYDSKHNLDNGHDNHDGPQEHSWNCGWEGEVDVPDDVMELRKRQAKNAFCLLMLSNGTPMFRMGDEFLQTQSGNSNPYNQDNETSWLNWDRLDRHDDVFQFVKAMIAFRKAHPSISRSHFWRDDIQWFGSDRPEIIPGPGGPVLAYRLLGKAFDDNDIYVMINGSNSDRSFAFHVKTSAEWQKAIDTSLARPFETVDQGSVGRNINSHVVESRSILVFISRS